ncbi:MAG: phage holin family protein [Bacteroidales bacterium]|nr:phage holin family protein [Bacteroidales bacterium]
MNPQRPTHMFYVQRSGCLLRLMVLMIAVMAGAWLLPGVEVSSFWAVMLTAVVISVLNNIVRPILIVITLPATALTLGLFLFVINAIIILMASGLVSGFKVDSFLSALLFSIVLTAVNYLLEWPNKYINRHNLSDSSQHQDPNNDDEGFTPYEEVE